MIDLSQAARMAALLGVVFLLLAGVFFLAERFGIRLGRLPGDLTIQRDGFTCVVPLASSLALSVLLTLLLNLILRIINK